VQERIDVIEPLGAGHQRQIRRLLAEPGSESAGMAELTVSNTLLDVNIKFAASSASLMFKSCAIRL